MRKVIYLITAITLFYHAQAGHVPEDKATKLARIFFEMKSHEQSPVITDIYVDYFDTVATFYAFSFFPKGFVIVSADDNVNPILAYSTTGLFDKNNIPSSVKDWLEQYSMSIYKVIIENQYNIENQNKWTSLLAGNVIKSTKQTILPLCTTLWDQGCYYNEMCPADTLGPCGHAVTGCVATAIAQVMKYWNYPSQGQGTHSYNSNWYGPLSANFGTTTYDWASMPDTVTSSNVAVATLMYQVGVSVDMDYYATSSSSDLYYALTSLPTYFKYSNNIEFVYKLNYTDSTWIELLKSELDAGRPVLYQGHPDSTWMPGHAWVCDGYDSNNYFHFNWGWGPGYGGYYEMGNFTYHNSNQALIKVMPIVNCDMSVEELTSPVSTTFTGPSIIKVNVLNNDTLTQSNVPVSYVVDGGTPVTETITGSIPGLSDTMYEFVQSYDFSLNPGHTYTIKTYTGLACDGYHDNDTITTQVENVACETPPYSMGFEPAENFNGWEIIDVNSDGNKWNFGSGGNTSPTCLYYNGGSNQANDWLISKCLELDSGKMYKLSFFYKVVSDFWPNKIKIFTGDQHEIAAMTTLLDDLNNIINVNYQSDEIYFTVPVSGSYYLGWQCYSDSDMYFCYLDDINITEQNAIDVALGSTTNLAEENCGLQTENITVTVKNLCSTILTNIPVSYSVNGATAITDTISTPIAVGDSLQYTFSTPVDLSATGNYNFVFYSSMPNDTLNGNDTLVQDISNHASASPDYSMEFEPTEDFSGWKIYNNNEDAYTWTIRNTGGRTQPYCIRYDYSSWLPAEDWFVSQCINLDATQTYKLDFWYKCEDAQWPEKLKVFLGDAQQPAALDTLLIDLPNIVNSNYQEATIYFTVPSTGLYYIGWYCYSDALMFNLYVDDIFLTLATSLENQNLDAAFTVFPNPANDKLTVETSNISKENMVYQIQDVNGRIVKQVSSEENRVSIPTGKLNSGIYFLKIVSRRGVVVKKIVKQ